MGSAALCLLGGFLSAAHGATVGDTERQVFQWRPFLAPFHAVVLHYPIGFLTVAVVLEVCRIRRPSEEVRRVVALILWLSLITGLLAASFGIMRAEGGDYEGATLNRHRALGMSIPVMMSLTLWLLWFAYRRGQLSPVRHLYRVALAGTFLLLIAAGHYGGSLTHGSRYLVENAPEFVREMMEEMGLEPDAGVVREDSGSRAFAAQVAPIFLNKCVQCHGLEKQKGGLRLDDPALVSKAGKSGKSAVVPGRPFESELVARILLPGASEDAMPPEGKHPLSSDEIVAIIRWVQQTGPASAGAAAATSTNVAN